MLDIDNGKCCFVVPIVPGIKTLACLISLTCVVTVAIGIQILKSSVPIWIKVLFGLDSLLMSVIAGLIDYWSKNDNKTGRKYLVMSCFLNVI